LEEAYERQGGTSPEQHGGTMEGERGQDPESRGSRADMRAGLNEINEDMRGGLNEINDESVSRTGSFKKRKR